MKKKNNHTKTVPKDVKALGFILSVFGAVTICAFFLPTKVWLVVLGVLLIITGFLLMKT